MRNVSVVDLFAGPGGLSEGFCAFSYKKNNPFRIISSVEMDPHAHQTLTLRSFFREFPDGKAPDEYYQYIRGEISKDTLFKKYPKQAKAASLVAMNITLGTQDGNEILRERIRYMLKQNSSPWVLIGGPPCQAYSTIGRSRQQANGVGREKHQKDHRNFLYKEYLKILAEFLPEVFIMENVPGILSAEIGGEPIFERILSDLRNPSRAISFFKSAKKYTGYKIYSLAVSESKSENLNPKDYIIKFENYGIPQARHRVILLGIRNDIKVKPRTLKKFKEKIYVESVISDLPKLRSDFTNISTTKLGWYEFIQSISSESWFRSGERLIVENEKGRKINLKEGIINFLRKIPKELTTGSEFIKTGSISPIYRKDWYMDKRLGGVINHTSRPHMDKDLYRYFYSAVYAHMTGISPRLTEFPTQLLPNHKNVFHNNGNMKFNDRFHVHLKSEPARTITCHLSKDGHSSIHYDPVQCRSLTPREAARIQTFPDNYYFEGPRTQKFKQIGNAVPPLIAYQIADIVFDVIKSIIN